MGYIYSAAGASDGASQLFFDAFGSSKIYPPRRIGYLISRGRFAGLRACLVLMKELPSAGA